MMPARRLLRSAAYRSGALTLARRRVRRSLTAVMLHRVIDPADPDYAAADPVYTVSAPLFDQLLAFFRDHHAVVSIEDVLAAAAGDRALPDHALLITFDDGWADNYRYAAPLLRARGMPAVIFTAAQAVQTEAQTWWQEEVFALGRSGRLDDWLARDDNRSRIMAGPSPGAMAPQVEVVCRLALLPAEERAAILSTLPPAVCHARMMMGGAELRRLRDLGVAVGLHGDRHVPLISVPDVQAELAAAQATLSALTDGAAVTTTLGCPHGLYDERVIAGAQAAGIRLVFTSDKRLNATEQGLLTRFRPLGRISIVQAHVAATPHRLDRGAAARWLWSHERR